MSSSERKTVAQELAVKDGHNWESLSAEQVNAYLHNADLVIEERSRAPVDEVNPKPVYTCDQCQDKAYIGEKPCSECNPVGLPVEEVHPKIVDEMPVVSISGGIPEGMEVGGSITTTSEEMHSQIENQPLAIEGEEDIQKIASKLFQLQQGKGDDLNEEEKGKVAEGKLHKHFYRKDGTCQCGQVKKVKKAK